MYKAFSHLLTILFHLLIFSTFTDAYAQHTVRNRSEKPNVKTHYMHALDSLFKTYNVSYKGVDNLSNPYYSALLGSPTLYRSTLHQMLGKLDGGYADCSTIPSSQHIYDICNQVNHYLSIAYTQYPWYVYHEEEKAGTLNLEDEIRGGVKQDKTFSEQVIEVSPEKEPAHIIPEPDDLDLVIRKPNFWTFKANFSLQFTQNYVSDNWYKGGESHNALLASTVLEANYNNQRKVTFDNKLEMKLGFQSLHNDDEHKFKTNSDLIRMTNKLGIRAIKQRYYTMMLQSLDAILSWI